MEKTFFEQLKEELLIAAKAVGNVGRLRLVAIVSRILGLFLLIFTLVLCIFALLAYGSVAAINALSACMPVWSSALIMVGVFVILMLIAIALRRTLFINPFIRLMTDQLIASEEQLALKEVHAVHEAELEAVRMQTRVENATRELNFYVSLYRRIRGAIAGLWKK